MLKSKYKDIQKSKYEQQKKAKILKAYIFKANSFAVPCFRSNLFQKHIHLKRAQSIGASDSSQNFKSTNELKTPAYRHISPS